MNWWHPERFEQKRGNMETRAKLVKAVRSFFDEQGFYEVETPILQVMPGAEPHLHAFKTELLNPHRDRRQTRYLHTSPEFAMKKLLVAGWPKIYQICHTFRNAEGSPQHNPEFTMIEWYRAHADYRAIMDDCVGLLRAVAMACNITQYRYKNMTADPFANWEILSVCEAFDKYAGFDLEPLLDNESALRTQIKNLDIHTAPDDTWDDLFMRVMGDIIEPHLGQGTPTIIYDYPVSLAALSRPVPSDPRFAERFELYVCGMELGNAFGELTDPQIQRKRFEEDMALKEKLYGERWPLDEDFLASLEHGMPESGGIALGIDRLVMLATGVENIKDISWCN
ncbi:MAG: EF-P lysine aminoacylase GenX [Rhodospirillales bacterium]|nr:EF-P lysine aminoacylase GenX [Rhodospirillales bacterium]